MKTALASVLIFVVGLKAFATSPFQYKRNYVEGNSFGYVLTTKVTYNGQFHGEEVGRSSHIVVKDSVLSEEITWESLEKKGAYGAQDLSAEAKRVMPYRISLLQGGSLALPPLKVPSMVGMITDLNTYYVAISHAVGIRKINEKEDVFQNPENHVGEWADGNDIVLGQDCTRATLTLVDLNSEVATVKTEFLAPDAKCIEMEKSWMNPPVKPGYPNNFQQIRKSGDQYMVMWGHEQFIVESEIDRKTGMIKNAEMDNTLTLKMKIGCDSTLASCQHEMPFIIQRDETLSLVN